MIHLRRLWAKLSSLFRNTRVEAELTREIAAHLALLEDDFRRQGMSEPDARLAARRAYGNVERARQLHRNERSILWIEQTIQNVRYAIRQLRKSPAFTAVAVTTLALGIGAVTSVFSVVNGVLLKPFGFRDPGRLVVVREMEDELRYQTSAIPDNYRHYLRLKQNTKTLEDMAIFSQGGESVSVNNGDHPRIVGSVSISPNLFGLLGVQPILGRDLTGADAVKGAASVVLLSYEGWQTLFQGNPQAIGQSLRMGMTPSTVIGILPQGMRLPAIALSTDISFQELGGIREPMVYSALIPSERDLSNEDGNFNYKVIARLKSGVTLAQARAELDGLQHAYSLSAHLPIHLGIAMSPLAQDVTSGISGALWLLLVAVGGVLLIGCVNLANLQLARTTAAERETAVRAALGASSAQLIMARLTESLVLAAVGGAAGVALAFAGVRLLMTLVPANVPRLDQVQVNWPVLLFAAGLSIAAAVLSGILPALRSLRVPPQAVLQANSSRPANSQEGRHTRNLLVAAEVACTVVLLIVTSLMLRSFSRLLRQDRGFDSSHVTAAQVDLFAPQYRDSLPNIKAVKLAFADRALAALQGLPGVKSVAVTSVMPLTGQTWVDELDRPDHPVPEAQRPLINVRWINPDYLATMQVPLVAGRNFAAADRADPYLALISERTAREGFPGENPVGRTIQGIVPDDKRPITVIGVAADTRINGLKDSAAMVYMPYWTWTPWTLTFLVRSAQEGNALIPEIRRALWEIDPQVAIPSLKAVDDQLSDSVATDRFQVQVLSSFAASALLLALMGVYGVLAYSVSLRHQEFGIRIALGSGKGALMQLVLLQAAYPVLLGAGVGLTLSFAALRWVRSLLYQTPLIDPLAIGGSLVALAAVAVLAAVLPARHAASIDPVQALRTQ